MIENIKTHKLVQLKNRYRMFSKRDSYDCLDYISYAYREYKCLKCGSWIIFSFKYGTRENFTFKRCSLYRIIEGNSWRNVRKCSEIIMERACG